MPKMPLTSQTLNELSDGLSGRVVDRLLNEIANDCDQRPNDDAPRKLVVTYVFKPEGNGQVDIAVRTKLTLPDIRPGSTKAKFDPRAGGLVFNTECAANPDQQTIPGTGRHDADE